MVENLRSEGEEHLILPLKFNKKTNNLSFKITSKPTEHSLRTNQKALFHKRNAEKLEQVK